MSDDKKTSNLILTPPFRVSYPNVFKPKLNEQSDKMEYSIMALFKKGENLDALKKAAMDAGAAKWGKDPKKWPHGWRNPFRDQGEKQKMNDAKELYLPEPYEEGAKFLTLKSTRKPGIVDQNREDILEESEIYPGCWCRAAVSVFTYGGPGTGFTAGINFGLVHLQKVRDDESLIGTSKPQDIFSPIEGAKEENGEEEAAAADASSLF